MFFPNLFKWIKSNATAIGIVATIILAIGAGIQGHRASKWEKEALRLDGKLQEQVADQNLLYEEAEKERGKRAVAEAKEKQVRKDLEARIQKFQKDTVAGKRALAQEKKKTAAIPPTELIQAINQRIGDESSLTGAGSIPFHPPGHKSHPGPVQRRRVLSLRIQ